MYSEASEQGHEGPLSRTRGRELFEVFFGRDGYSRLRKRDAQQLLALDADTDLRSLPDEPDFKWANPLRVLLVQGCDFDLEPFLTGVPVGPLASLPVYASDLRKQYAGKSHAPGLCQHSRRLGLFDERTSLGAWVPVLIQLGVDGRWSEDYPFCSKCGGFAIWRMSDEQLFYYDAAQRLGRRQIPRMLDRYELVERSKDKQFYRAEWDRLPTNLENLEAELVTLDHSNELLREVVAGQMARCRALARRIQAGGGVKLQISRD